ncbi:MAG: hypothetical protein LBM74_04235 [Oscillospiraceae bacterium]|jgi:hypothetical protein|nr:hypothetical protein [Oscillospiraceae bacterium]
MKKISIVLICLVVAALLLAGCSKKSNDLGVVMLGSEYLYSEKTSDGRILTGGFAFSSSTIYSIRYTDGVLTSYESTGSFTRDGNTLYLTYLDGSSTTATIIATRDGFGNYPDMKQAYQIAIYNRIYTLKE